MPKYRLAYYPPYHSKYNPIERTWGILENHWNGSILDEIDTILNFARTMHGRVGILLLPWLLESTKLGSTYSMAEVENQIIVQDERFNKWFVAPVPMKRIRYKRLLANAA